MKTSRATLSLLALAGLALATSTSSTRSFIVDYSSDIPYIPHSTITTATKTTPTPIPADPSSPHPHESPITYGSGISSSSPDTTITPVAHYGQCGGQGFGPTRPCAAPYSCVVIADPWYSQCL